MDLKIIGLKVDAGSGPGSRGGHVIGHTTSGKPIYLGKKPGKPFSKNINISTDQESFADQHIHWSSKDHEEAVGALSYHAKAFPRTAKISKLHESLAVKKAGSK